MSLLPMFARDLGIDAPTAGHVIGAYALGVVVGAPVIALVAAPVARRTLLTILMGMFALANGMSGLAPTYHWMLVFRFLSGLPHGAYFGAAALMATLGIGAIGFGGMFAVYTYLANVLGAVTGVSAQSLRSCKAYLAWALRGLAISAGYGCTAPGWVGSLLAIGGRVTHICITTAMMTEMARTPNSMAVKRGYLMFIIILVLRNRNFIRYRPLSSPCGLPH
ncbi:MAG: transporter, family, inner rane transport protein [Paraburkholderia sp.]|nr:transporter, family, inner rane transport protein [Paraburkholderia sp.]